MGSWDVQNFYVLDAIVPNLLNSESEIEMNQDYNIRSLVSDVFNDLNS